MAYPTCEFCGKPMWAYAQRPSWLPACKCDKRHHFPWTALGVMSASWLLVCAAYIIYGFNKHWYLFIAIGCCINMASTLEKRVVKEFVGGVRKWLA